jgi:hypothetical protein
MRKHQRRNRLAGAASIGIAVAAISMTLGTSAAFASNPPDPSGGATPVAPHFYNGNADQIIRGAGSDASFFLEQRISDLYTGSGLYGCTLNNAPGQTLYNTSDPASTGTNEEFYCQANANTATSDTTDNWDKTEVSQGTSLIGSTAGQEQLCGTLSSPDPVDYARGAKPPLSVASGGCSTEAPLGFAKDGLPGLAFPTDNPSVWGTAPGSSPYASVNGGVIGPVAAGWLPGDPTSGPYNGTALTSLSNADNGGGSSSTAYRIWCATGTTRISDWGQLTNLGPKLEIADVTTTASSSTVTLSAGAPEGTTFPAGIVASDAVSGPGIPSGTTVSANGGSSLTLSKSATAGSTTATLVITTGSTLTEGSGIAYGLPIRVVGISTAAGIEGTWASYAESGVSGGGCSAPTANTNAAADPNPSTAPSPNSPHIMLQNNASQIADYAVSDFPGDAVDQAIEIGTSLVYESNGVYNTNPFAAASEVTSGSTTISYTGDKLSMNGETPTVPNLLNNFYPTAFTLSNIYRTDTVRASTAGFLNWICDANDDFTKGTDDETGINFDTELQTLITGTFGFARLTDTSVSPSNGGTPADNVAAPNTTCAAGTVPDGSLTQGNGIPGVTAVAQSQS